MKVFLAGLKPFLGKILTEADVKGIFALESFYYADKTTERYLPLFKDFLLDSGAYTFFSGKQTKGVNWEEYVDKYADFIKRNNVKKFFELDIDKLIGYDKVIELRKRLEKQVGRQCIPVWHKTRGKDEYLKICDEYGYISVGGLVGAGGAGVSAYSKEVAKYFPWFVNEAHKRGAKIHALGYTSVDGLKKYHFDSVDSTSWIAGNRFGFIYKFNGNDLQKIHRREGQRLANFEKTVKNNFNEWKKFQQYADIML